MPARLADTVPHACSACFTQKLGLRHVDFDVFYDGPMMYEQTPGGPNLKPIDDLIICEECLGAAGKVVGLGNVEQAEADAAQHRAVAEAALDRALAAESKLQELETALEVLRVPNPTVGARRKKAV